MKEFVKIRRVGGSTVVSLPQSVLEPVDIAEGDRVLVEASPPRRLIITKEEEPTRSTQRLEIEIGVLASRKIAIESDLAYKREQHSSSTPCDEGMSDKNLAGLIMSSLVRDRDRLSAEIAGKRLALFDVVGVTTIALPEPADETSERGQVETLTSTQGTHAEQILRSVATLAGVDGQGDFTRKQVRKQIGVSAHEWQSGYTAIFQAMRDDQPGSAPPIAQTFRALFHRVAHGVYKLNALGRRMVNNVGADDAD